jgi:hypothetical protein
MARNQQALELLDRSAWKALELGDQVENNTGLLSAMREGLDSARRDLRSHARTNPLEKRQTKQKAERLLAATVEYVNEILVSLARKR